MKLVEKLYKEYDVKKKEWKHFTGKDIEKSKDGANKDLTDELFDMISKAYASIGGHVAYKKASDLPAKADSWSAVDIDSDPEPDVVNFYKNTKNGKKSVGSATDGTDLAKKFLLASKVRDLSKTGFYAEVSGAIAHILITRNNAPFVNNEEDVKKVLGKDIEWVGLNPNGKYPKHAGWYYRKLGDGKKHLKIMLGKPKI